MEPSWPLGPPTSQPLLLSQHDKIPEPRVLYYMKPINSACMALLTGVTAALSRQRNGPIRTELKVIIALIHAYSQWLSNHREIPLSFGAISFTHLLYTASFVTHVGSRRDGGRRGVRSSLHLFGKAESGAASAVTSQVQIEIAFFCSCPLRSSPEALKWRVSPLHHLTLSTTSHRSDRRF